MSDLAKITHLGANKLGLSRRTMYRLAALGVDIRQEISKAPPGRLLRAKEVATVCGLSVSTIHRWIETGTLKAFRIGRSIRITEESLQSLLKEIDPGE